MRGLTVERMPPRSWKEHRRVTDLWLRDLFDPEEAASLTAELVAIRGYPGQEGPVQRHVAGWLEANGLAPEFQVTKRSRKSAEGRGAILQHPTLAPVAHVALKSLNFWGTRGRRFFAVRSAAETRDDSARVDIRPGAGLFPSFVVRGEPRQHGGQIVDVETLSTGEKIAQAVVEQVGRVPGRPLFVEYPAEDVRLINAVGRRRLSE
jgi:hypothetical protein